MTEMVLSFLGGANFAIALSRFVGGELIMGFIGLGICLFCLYVANLYRKRGKSNG